MAPAIRGGPASIVASASNVVTPTTLAPTLPTHQTGDLLLCYTTCRSSTPTVATPAGWTELVNIAATNGRIVLYGKVAASSSEATPSVVWSGLTTGSSGTPCLAQCVVFSGCQATITGIVDVLGTVENGAASATVVASGTAITTVTNEDLVLSLATRQDDAGVWTIPTGFNLIAGAGTTSGLDMGYAWCWQAKTPQGSVSPNDYSLSGGVSAASSAVLVALKPLVVVPVTYQKAGSLTPDPLQSGVGRREAPRTGSVATVGRFAGVSLETSALLPGSYGFGGYGDGAYGGVTAVTYPVTGTIVGGSFVSAADASSFVETGLAAARLLFGGAEQLTRVESGALAARGFLAGIDSFAASEAGTLAAATWLSALDQATLAESGALVADTSLSGGDVSERSETGALAARATLAGAKSKTASEMGSVSSGGFVSGGKQLVRSAFPGTIAASGFVAGPKTRELAPRPGSVTTGGEISGFRLRERSRGGVLAAGSLLGGRFLHTFVLVSPKLPVVVASNGVGGALLVPGSGTFPGGYPSGESSVLELPLKLVEALHLTGRQTVYTAFPGMLPGLQAWPSSQRPLELEVPPLEPLPPLVVSV